MLLLDLVVVEKSRIEDYSRGKGYKKEIKWGLRDLFVNMKWIGMSSNHG